MRQITVKYSICISLKKTHFNEVNKEVKHTLSNDGEAHTDRHNCTQTEQKMQSTRIQQMMLLDFLGFNACLGPTRIKMKVTTVATSKTFSIYRNSPLQNESMPSDSL